MLATFLAVACADDSRTYAELEERANRLAHHLAAHGVGAGDHVGFCVRNSVRAIETMLAVYKLREGQAIGCKVTLRKVKMYEFVDRLVNIALPRVRDFRGLNPKSFDGRGNYSLGLKEHIVFPEIDYEKSGETWGMDITVCTTADDDEQARALLTAFNFPFRQ